MLNTIEDKSILEAIYKNSYNSIVITDANLELPGPKILFVNEAFTKKTGYTLQEIQGQTPRILQGELTERNILDELKIKCKNGEDFTGTTVNYRKDGSKYYVQWNVSAIKNTQGETTNYISIQRNITLEVETIKTLQKVIDQQKNIIAITDGLELKFVNQSFKKFFGVQSLEEFLLQDPCVCSRFNKVDGFYYKKTKDEQWIKAIESLTSENRIVSMQDRDFMSHGFFVGIDLFDANKYIITFTDITETIGSNLSLQYKAYHDNLSGAYNREFIHKKFDFYKNEAHQHNLLVGLIMFDIDHFKNVNDTYGHNVGDKIIQRIVEIALETTRVADYVVRWGGEEFLVLTRVKVLEQLQTIAEHIRIAFENESFQPVPLITASFGVAAGTQDDTLESLVKKADAALYKAKETGRNKVCTNL